MADRVTEIELKLRELDSRIRVLNRATIQTMDDTLALWDVLVELKKRAMIDPDPEQGR